MKIMACYSIKGGVGKTAAAVNFAMAAAEDGLRTLLLDLDPQGASSFYFRVSTEEKFKSRWLLTSQDKLLNNIRSTDFNNLDILPANLSYRHLDVVLKKLNGDSNNLKKALKPLAKNYDLLILDCPPSISLLSENIFHCADIVLVPVIPTTLSERTLEQLTDFFKSHDLSPKKIVPFLSMVNSRVSLHKDISLNLQKRYKRLLRGYIPQSAEIEKMGKFKAPLATFARHHISTRCYEMMWNEIRTSLL